MNRFTKLLCPLLCAAWLPALVSAQGPAIHVPDSAPFAPDAIIKQAIRTDCGLPTYLSGQIAQQFQAQGVPIASSDQGDDLQLEISDAVSEGNAFIGHHKYVTVKGKLLRQGQVVASFIDKRNSMGGALAGFKGSCTVLQRCADALAEDIAGWARSPTMGAQLGDLR